MEIDITQKERELLALLAKGKNLTEACNELHIKKQTGSQRIRRLKDRYLRARDFCDDYERWRAKLPGKYL